VTAAPLFHARPKLTPAVLGSAEKGKLSYDLDLQHRHVFARKCGARPFEAEYPHRPATYGRGWGCHVLLFANSPVAPFFELPDGMDLVKLPSVRKISAGNWEPARLRMDKQLLKTLRADLLRSVLLNYRPDLLLVDHMPAGVQGELLPALKALKEAHPDCSVVLGLRDILDAPEVTSQAWESEGAYEALRHYYDRVPDLR